MVQGNASSAGSTRLLMATFPILLLVTAACASLQTESGSCWKLRRSDGSCGRLLRANVTKESCCFGRHRRGWSGSSGLPSPGSFASNSSSRNSVISDPPPPMCAPCAPATCTGMRCGEDRKCVVRDGAPRCVCSPQCHLKHKASVCGSDGRTYVSECHLLKRACRKKRRLLVTHYGPCQTCSGVRCSAGKTCVLDEQLIPRCVRCPTTCPAPEKPRPICGADGRTHPSPCHLKRASCRAQKEIPRAYKGACRDGATCNQVRCWREQRCLTHVSTGMPQCTWCGSLDSCRTSSRPICASDGKVYPSWCALRHEACRSGRALPPALHHHCSANGTKTDDCKLDSGKRGKQRKDRRKQKKLKERRERLHRLQDLGVVVTTPNSVAEGDRVDSEQPDAPEVAVGSAEGERGEEEGDERRDSERKKKRRRRRKGCRTERGKKKGDRRAKGGGE
ncbi:follistatin-like isoform X1 [Penaeus indicus]|uniref:follistatin-like isoform X1 n=1 Tax=Penaeus indicus TaxID=29960 RepID=UPI00300C6E06